MASRLDDLIREHAERLDQLAGPIHLTDVTSGPRHDQATVTLIDTEPTPTQPEARRRWPIIAVAAALVAIAVCGLVLVIGDDERARQVPADQPPTNAPTTVAQMTEESLQMSARRVREAAARRVGFVGLPPVGARPSTPVRGTLAFTISHCTDDHGLDRLTLFADGRMIWALSGRLVEQRLTPEGVELLLSELADSGLLNTHTAPDGDECESSYYGHMQVGDHEYGVEFGAALDDPRIARLIDPWSWLPASAWADSEIKAFVASEYSVSIMNGSPSGGPTTNPAPELPAAVQELVRAKEWECQVTANGPWCYTMANTFSTDEVRTLAEALHAAGFVAENTGTDLEYHDETSIRIELSPRLPWQVRDDPIPD